MCLSADTWTILIEVSGFLNPVTQITGYNLKVGTEHSLKNWQNSPLNNHPNTRQHNCDK
jgi:hypothetical protein